MLYNARAELLVFYYVCVLPTLLYVPTGLFVPQATDRDSALFNQITYSVAGAEGRWVDARLA